MHTSISHVPTSNAEYSIYNIRHKPQPSLMLALPDSDEYDSIAQHIRTVFQKTYGAEIEVTYPLLMGFIDMDSTPLAALGIRHADNESMLFLEHYLDQPVETYLHAITGQYIERNTIAEAGNLASTGKNDILMLLYGLACHLEQEGMSYIIFTGTALLRRYLGSLGLYPYVLADAKPERLGQDATLWGKYYASHPKVMAGSVPAFLEGLENYCNYSAAKRGGRRGEPTMART